MAQTWKVREAIREDGSRIGVVHDGSLDSLTDAEFIEQYGRVLDCVDLDAEPELDSPTNVSSLALERFRRRDPAAPFTAEELAPLLESGELAPALSELLNRLCPPSW